MSFMVRKSQPVAEVFVPGLKSVAPELPPPPEPTPTDGVLPWRNRLDHWEARWGYKRSQHRVTRGSMPWAHPTPRV